LKFAQLAALQPSTIRLLRNGAAANQPAAAATK
jgi:hypothetical protein